MIRRNLKFWIALASVASLSTMAGTANAISTNSATGIVIKGTYGPGTGDPPYDYTFDVILAPGFSLTSGESFTIDGLIGITPASLSGYTGPYLGDFGYPAITETNSTAPYASNVTWTYGVAGIPFPPIGPSSSPIDLGSFTIETFYDFPNGTSPYMPGATVSFQDQNGVTGTFQFEPASVPEPASAILLLLGTAAIPVVMLRQRRHATAHVSAEPTV